MTINRKLLCIAILFYAFIMPVGIAHGYALTSPGLAMAQIDLDDLYDPKDRTVLDRNIDDLIGTCKKDGITTVAIQAFCDESGTGETQAVYFYTRHAPIKANILNQAAKRFKNAGIAVYAWMPTLSGQWLSTGDPDNLVQACDTDGLGWYHRATPFSQKTQRLLRGLFSDLALYHDIDGVLFQDDLFLNDFEDFSVAATEAYYKKFNESLTPDIQSNPAKMKRWTTFKVDALNTLTMELMNAVRQHKPHAKFLRNIYAEAVLDPYAKEWYAQDFSQYLKLYDGAVIMAYPYMEGAPAPDKWMRTLFSAAKKAAAGKENKVIIKIQTLDWKTQKAVPPYKIKAWIRALKKYGFTHYGLYPYTQ